MARSFETYSVLLVLMTAPAWMVPRAAPAQDASVHGTTYIPLDSWIYPALLRLKALGVLDDVFVGLRPWTRVDIAVSLRRAAESARLDKASPEARELYSALVAAFADSEMRQCTWMHPSFVLDSQYTRVQGIAGLPLRDSFHLGMTNINDYGRPYQEGFNAVVGSSASAIAGRAALYVRGEYQHAPGAPGYNSATAAQLATIDQTPNTPQPTIPAGPIGAVNAFRIVEANLSYRLLNHQISIGKSDHWLGPAQGGSLLWSNNAENIYTFQIDRTTGLSIPYFSRVFGPLRYLFYVGSLKGHTAPNDPWVHVEKISLQPTRNLELGFSRATIWGGKGHAPITVGSFLHSFFSVQNVSLAEKLSRNDPGDRIGNFDVTYRPPLLRNWLTLYCDSLVHDDVSPIDAPRRAAIRPGIYLPSLPHLPRLDLRLEAANTDPPVSRSNGGGFLYTEDIQKQGYTNNGQLTGDAVGREGKTAQGWLTYHLSAAEQIQFAYRNAKAAKDFIPGGTTQNQWQVSVTKRLRPDLELKAMAQDERWRAPVYKPHVNQDAEALIQLTWFPARSR